MNYHLDVTRKENYVRIQFCGELTAENQEKVIEDIYLMIFNSGERNALVDRRAGPLDPHHLQNFKEADFISDLPFIYHFKIAVLMRPEDIDHSALLETVAAKRGVNWKFFNVEEDAVRWLTT